MLLTVFGGVLVYAAIHLNINLRTRTNAIFLSLVTADIFMALFVMPFEIVLLSYYPHWPLGESACNIWSSMYVVLGSASVCHLCAIGVDRFLAISRPLQYSNDISTFVVVSLVLLWFFAFCSGISSYFIWKQPNPQVCTMLTAPFESSVLFLAFDLLIPFVICLVTYAKIFQISRQQARRIIATRAWFNRNSNSLPMERKSTRTLSLLVGSFTITFLPFLIFHALDGALQDKLPNRFYFDSVVKWPSFANNAMNWALYGFLNQDYRRAFITLFNSFGCRCLACRREIIPCQ